MVLDFFCQTDLTQYAILKSQHSLSDVFLIILPIKLRFHLQLIGGSAATSDFLVISHAFFV